MSSIPSSQLAADIEPVIIAIYEEKYALYYNVAWHYVKDAAAAEDIVQNVFIKIFDSMEKVAHLSRNELEKYLMVMVKHEGIRAVRSLQVEFPLEHLEDRPSQGYDVPCEKVMQNFEQELMRKAVAKLSDRYRFCLEMKYLYDMPTKEICKLTHTTPHTFATLLQRARDKLREIYLQLEKWGE